MKKTLLHIGPIQYRMRVRMPQGAKDSGKRVHDSVKVIVTVAGDSVYTATGRAEQMASIPRHDEPFVVQVADLHATGRLGLVFVIDDVEVNKPATTILCRKGQIITWKLVPVPEV